MKISHQEGNHLVCLTDVEAQSLVEACALVVLAVESDPRISIPPQMGTVLCELFEGLRPRPPHPPAAVDQECF